MCTTATGMVADARTRVDELGPAEVEAAVLSATTTLVDVREADERWRDGWIAGSVHVPRGVLEFWADPSSLAHRSELDPRRRTVVYCGTGQRSALAAQALQHLGYRDVAHLRGGLEAWHRQGYAVSGRHPWHTD